MVPQDLKLLLVVSKTMYMYMYRDENSLWVLHLQFSAGDTSWWEDSLGMPLVMLFIDEAMQTETLRVKGCEQYVSTSVHIAINTVTTVLHIHMYTFCRCACTRPSILLYETLG